MVQLPVPNTVRIVFRGLIEAQEIINTIHVTKLTGGAPTPLNVLDVTEAMATVWREQVMLVTGFQYTYNSTVGTDLTVVDGAQHTSTVNSGLQGENANGSRLPNNVALCVSLRTGLSGRSRRGRMYLAGMTAGMLTNANQITEAHRNNVLVAITALINELPIATEGVWRPVIVSRYFDGLVRPAPVVTEIASALITDTTVDSQRRRLPGRGR